MILLVVAVEKELAGLPARSGVTALVGGVGPVECACAVAAELSKRRYALVVSAGLAGAFEGAATIGDGVVLSEDAMEVGLENGAPLALPDGEKTIERARSDPALVAALERRGFAALRGITVARVTSTGETARRLAALGAQAETMEGFAALRAAERAGVRAIEVRGISNRAGARETSGWDFAAGAGGLSRALATLFTLPEIEEFAR